MCRDPVCTVAEVWCSSEHYLWLFDGGILYIVGGVYCIVLLSWSLFLRLLKLRKLAVCKLDTFFSRVPLLCRRPEHLEMKISQLFRKLLVTSPALLHPGQGDFLSPTDHVMHPHYPCCDVPMSNKRQTDGTPWRSSVSRTAATVNILLAQRQIAQNKRKPPTAYSLWLGIIVSAF